MISGASAPPPPWVIESDSPREESPEEKRADPVLADLLSHRTPQPRGWLAFPDPVEDEEVEREGSPVLARLRSGNSKPEQKRVSKWNPVKTEPSPKPLRRPKVKAQRQAIRLAKMTVTPRGTKLNKPPLNMDTNESKDEKAPTSAQQPDAVVLETAEPSVIMVVDQGMQPSLLAQFDRLRDAKRNQTKEPPNDYVNEHMPSQAASHEQAASHDQPISIALGEQNPMDTEKPVETANDKAPEDTTPTHSLITAMEEHVNSTQEAADEALSKAEKATTEARRVAQAARLLFEEQGASRTREGMTKQGGAAEALSKAEEATAEARRVAQAAKQLFEERMAAIRAREQMPEKVPHASTPAPMAKPPEDPLDVLRNLVDSAKTAAISFIWSTPPAEGPPAQQELESEQRSSRRASGDTPGIFLSPSSDEPEDPPVSNMLTA